MKMGFIEEIATSLDLISKAPKEYKELVAMIILARAIDNKLIIHSPIGNEKISSEGFYKELIELYAETDYFDNHYNGKILLEEINKEQVMHTSFYPEGVMEELLDQLQIHIRTFPKRFDRKMKKYGEKAVYKTYRKKHTEMILQMAGLYALSDQYPNFPDPKEDDKNGN